MSKIIKLKVFSAIFILALISWLGFSSLPSLQQTGGNLLFVVVAVLSGPIVGAISILVNNNLENSYPILILGLIICAPAVFWH
jgi:hypothetical protein